jgi:D-alanyl-D-alanine carboxypeptidase (penicillin-binding protein 5/6)
MKIRCSKGLGGLIVLLFIFSLLCPAPANAQTAFDVEAGSAILVDLKTGTILFEKNGDEALPPASMSKMMTEYLVMEAIEEGHINWDTPVTVSEYAHYIAGLDGTSRVWLAQGEKRTVKELYTAMAVYSANDATVALAEAVAGSEQQFVQMMNEKADALGMTNTRYVNSTGLPNDMLGPYVHTGEASDENAMSARDTAILARALLSEYPEVLDFSSIPVVEPGKGKGQFPVRLINFNWMLPGHPNGSQYSYDGLDGLKTGFTDLAKYCFTATAEKNGLRLISVVMRTESESARFAETRKLLDYGFKNFGYHTFAEKGDKVAGSETLSVAQGKELEVPVVLGKSLEALIQLEETDQYTIEVEPIPDLVNEQGELVAPLEEGEPVASARLVYNGELQFGSLGPAQGLEAPLVTEQAVEEAGLFRKAWRGVTTFFSGLWSNVVEQVTSWF